MSPKAPNEKAATDDMAASSVRERSTSEISSNESPCVLGPRISIRHRQRKTHAAKDTVREGISQTCVSRITGRRRDQHQGTVIRTKHGSVFLRTHSIHYIHERKQNDGLPCFMGDDT